MKRKLYMLFMLFNVFVATSCANTDPDLGSGNINPDSLPDDLDKLLAETTLNKISIEEEVCEDFSLDTLIDSLEITYTSSSSLIVIDGNTAIVTRGEYDQNVVITAVVNYNGKEYSKSFYVKILKYDFENIIPEVLASIKIPTTTSENFTLPTNVSGVSIVWTSDSETISIVGNEAVITQGYTDVTVSLSAKATYEIFETTKVYDVKVEKLSNPIEGILNEISLSKEVDEDFNLVTEINSHEIHWESDNEEIIKIEDGFAEVEQAYYDTVVNLTATTTFQSFTEVKSYSIKVLGDEQNPLDGILDSLIIPNTVENDFYLQPTIDGYDISYSTNNNAITIQNGVALVTRSSISDVTVIISATIFDTITNPNTFEEEQISLTKTFSVVVKQKVNPIENILNDLVLPTEVRSSFELETSLFGYNVTYTSNSDYIVIDGTNAIVTRTTQDINVTITAIVEAEGFVERKSFNITVIKLENKIPTILDELTLPTVTNDSFDLVTLIDGVTLSYISSCSTITIVDNKAVVTPKAYDTVVTLVVTAQDSYYEGSKIINILVNGLYAAPETLTAYETYSIIANVLNEEKYYIKDASGISSASIVDQNVSNITVKNNDYVYFTALSSSTFAYVNHKALFYNNQVASSHILKSGNTQTISTSTLDTYNDNFGVDASGIHFAGYEIDESSLNSTSSYIGYENGLHSFKLVVDPNSSAVDGMKQQIYKFGGLTKLPTMKTIEITLFYDNDFRLHSTTSYEFYVVTKKVIWTDDYDTKQNLTTTFTYYNDGIPSELISYDDYLNKLN